MTIAVSILHIKIVMRKGFNAYIQYEVFTQSNFFDTTEGEEKPSLNDIPLVSATSNVPERSWLHICPLLGKSKLSHISSVIIPKL